MVCATIKPSPNKVCIANMDKRIKIQTTYATTNNAPNTTPTASFVDITGAWAMVKTTPSTQWIDGVQTSVAVNTDFYIRYNSAIDFERKLWVELNDRKYKVINIENIDKQDNIIRLRTSETGAKTINANLR